MKKFILGLSVLLLLFAPMYVFASSNAPNLSYNSNYTNVTGTCLPDQIDTVFGCVGKGEQSLPVFVRMAFAWFAGLVGSVAVLGLIWAAYTYVTSGGNPDSISKAKDIIFTSVASVVVIIFSWAFFKLLGVV